VPGLAPRTSIAHASDATPREVAVGTIVVGVDGSEGSSHGLRWAAAEARLRGCTLQAVYVYEHNPSWQIYGYSAEIAAIPVSSMPDDTHSREVAQSLVEHLVRELGDVGVPVEAIAQEDRRPAHALVERSRDAELLVVGSRGRGGFAGLVLGSVSQQCVQHARCPVVVMPHPEDHDR
jgi:nucleotide-binding universal stress UspA family protein